MWEQIVLVIHNGANSISSFQGIIGMDSLS